MCKIINIGLKWIRVVQLSTELQVSDFNDDFVAAYLPLELIEKKSSRPLTIMKHIGRSK